MRLPKDILSNNYIRPRLFLSETDKSIICQLDTTNLNGSFKFNSYSELTFEVARTYNNMLTGDIQVNPYYDKIEAVRLVYLENFGYFELQAPELVSDGIKESKSCTAYSLEYTLSTKYLEDFYVNTGEVNSIEVIYAEDVTGDINNVIPVTLYNPTNPKLSLLHLILEKDYGNWKIGHVDPALRTLSRQFEVDRESIYDFIINEICEKFNCYVVFDTINNTINVYAESLTSKFIGDGATDTFVVSPPFSQIGTVSVDGYKTTRYSYDENTGIIILEDIPESGAYIEIIDGALTEWETDVFVTFDNLSQEININYEADAIKTVLTVTFGEDNDIREVNLGLPYITDLSYFTTPDWMGEDLYAAWIAYQQKCNNYQSNYTNNSQKMLYYAGQIDHEENRLSLGYAPITVDENSVGTYYVRGGTDPNYYYTEVSLPSEYKAGTTYYSPNTTNVTEEKISNLYEVLKKYFHGDNDWETEFDALSESFEFVKGYTLADLHDGLKNATTINEKDTLVSLFLDEIWDELGRMPLKTLYYEAYKKVQITNIEAGWSQKDNNNYGYYYPVVLYLETIEAAIAKRDTNIADYQQKYNALMQANSDMSNDLLMTNNFTEKQLVRLSAFLREDELQLDDIITTSEDSVADTYKNQQDAMESGRIELQKLSQPQLQFSMSMANIYALPEFEPIIDQFQLGNVIKVGLRSDYIKQSRLLQVDINFDDFSDFSVEFGDLTSLRTQSDIHADLLKNAISAGKSVAQNASYWTRGSDVATSTDLKIKQGLLDAVEAIKSTDGNQSASLDKYGLHLELINPVTGEKDPEQIWLVNNKIVFTDDNFKTSRMALGRLTVDGQEYYGIISEIMLAGYIEGSQIVGCNINIGDGAFVVDGKTGMVTMSMPEGSTINGYAKEEQVQNIQDQVDGINESKMYRVEITTTSSTVISTDTDEATLICRVYSWDIDITDTLEASLFTWKRSSKDSASDEIWNTMPEHQGTKSIIVTAIDVVENSSFTCEVDLPY